jgi:hypothetical protein
MGGLPKDERSRVGERGERGAVLQCDWAAELRGPPAVQWGGASSRSINALFRLPDGTSRALVPKVRQLVRLGSVCGASKC